MLKMHYWYDVSSSVWARCLSSDASALEGSSLFVGDEPGRDGPLQHLLRYAESISNWIAAEIVITDSVKVIL